MGMTDSKLDFAAHLDFSAILTNPILDIAARVWDKDRYNAFKVCYRSMRLIDDLVDERKSAGTAISETEVALISQQMERWLDSIRHRQPADSYSEEFIEVLDRFEMPLWPWERLCRSMLYDLTHDGFPTFIAFARYCEGAAISPAAIFMHLCGVTADDGGYRRPGFNIRRAARTLAIFSYLTHTMRDFEKDQRNNLNCFADSLIARAGASRSELLAVAHHGVATRSLRALMSEYVRIAEYYRVRSRKMIDQVRPQLEPRYQLSLELIYSLYLQIYERVDPNNGQFTGAALNPSPEQVQDRIRQTIDQFRPVAV
jgi:15-cis-phytoene synthase